MPAFFVDSSALVKRYRNEEGSQRVSEQVESAERLIIARLTKVEVTSALVRRARDTNMLPETLEATLIAFNEELQKSFDIVELDEALMEQAVVMAQKHALRGADAIQLACLRLARSDVKDRQFILLSSDEELNTAAADEGLTVENPTRHS